MATAAKTIVAIMRMATAAKVIAVKVVQMAMTAKTIARKVIRHSRKNYCD